MAKLRAAKTNDAPLLLKMDLESGHFSASDRYKYLEQLAFEYAFLLDNVHGWSEPGGDADAPRAKL